MLGFSCGPPPQKDASYERVMEHIQYSNDSDYADSLPPKKREEYLAMKRAEARQLAAFAERRHHTGKEPYEPFLGDRQPKTRPLMELEDDDEDNLEGSRFRSSGSGRNAARVVASSRPPKRSKDSKPRRSSSPSANGAASGVPRTTAHTMADAYQHVEDLGTSKKGRPSSEKGGRSVSLSRKSKILQVSDSEEDNGGSAAKKVSFKAGDAKAEKKDEPKKKTKRNQSLSDTEQSEPEDQGEVFPPYEARPGEERLAEAIAAEMVLPERFMWDGSRNRRADCSWDDIGGLEDAKQALLESIVLPMAFPQLFSGLRRPHKGILLFGPPGTGKTMLAKAVASQTGTSFFNVSPATLTSKWRGEGEKLIRILFEMAQHYAPSVIFIDEIDALTGDRGSGHEHEASRRSKTELLAQIDGMSSATKTDGGEPKMVMVIGATNLPWEVDTAFRRRMERRVHIPLPGEKEREALLKMYSKDLTLDHSDVDFAKLATLTAEKLYSAHDIHNVVREAAMLPIRRVSAKHQKDFSGEVSTTTTTAGGSSNTGVRGTGLDGVVMQGLVSLHSKFKHSPAELLRIQTELVSEPCFMEDFVRSIEVIPSSVDLQQVKRHEQWAKDFANTY